MVLLLGLVLLLGTSQASIAGDDDSGILRHLRQQEAVARREAERGREAAAARLYCDVGDVFMARGEFLPALESYRRAEAAGHSIASEQERERAVAGISRAYIESAAPMPTALPRIAVVKFSASGDSHPDLNDGFHDALVAALSQDERVVVLEYSLVDAVLQETRLGLTGAIKPAALRSVGRLLSADLVVKGRVDSAHSQVTATAELLDVGASASEFSVSRSDNAAAILRLQDVFAAAFVKRLGSYLERKANVRTVPEPPAGNDARSWLERGFFLAAHARHREAVDVLRKAVAMDPRPRFKLELGSQLEMTGRQVEALKLYESLLRSQPKSGESYFLDREIHERLGTVSFQTGNAVEAVAHFEAGLRAISRRSPSAHKERALMLSNLAVALGAAGRSGEVVPRLQEASQEARRSRDAALLAAMLHNLGATLAASHDLDGAAVALDEALVAASGVGEGGILPDILSARGDVESMRQNSKMAAFLYQKSIDVARTRGGDSELPRLYCLLGISQLGFADPEAATVSFERVLASSPSASMPVRYEAHRGLGTAWANRQRADLAKRNAAIALDLARAMQDRAKERQALRSLAQIYALFGDAKNARRYSEEAQSVAPTGARAGAGTGEGHAPQK